MLCLALHRLQGAVPLAQQREERLGGFVVGFDCYREINVAGEPSPCVGGNGESSHERERKIARSQLRAHFQGDDERAPPVRSSLRQRETLRPRNDAKLRSCPLTLGMTGQPPTESLTDLLIARVRVLALQSDQWRPRARGFQARTWGASGAALRG